MKSNIRKVFCVITALCCFFSTMSIMSYALTPEVEIPNETRYSGDILNFDPGTYIDTSKVPIRANKFFSSGADDMYYFYTYLDANQKSAYDTLKNAGVCIGTAISVPLVNPIVVTAPVVDNILQIPSSAYNQISEILVGGMTALMDDCPEFFWCNSFGYGIDGFDYKYLTGSNYRVTIKSVSITVKVNTSVYANESVITEYYNNLLESVNNFEVHGITRYEKLKSIHDTIVRQVQYDPNYNKTNKNPTNHEPVSVFNAPYLTVCEGYAEAFKLICNREKIPCVVVVGDANGGHAWNYVKMEDNKWYAIDATWNDPINNGVEDVYYDYFLVGSDTNEVDSKLTFGVSHTPVGDRFGSGTFYLTYPTLNKTAYCSAFSSKNSTANVRADKGLIYIDKDADAASSLSLPFGYSGTIDGATTGANISISKDNNAVASYTLIRRGDVDQLNGTTRDDYEIIVANASAKGHIASQSASFYAADMNYDDAVDGFDAIAHELYTKGELQYN